MNDLRFPDGVDPFTSKRMKKIRRESTDIENKLRSILDSLKIAYETQVNVENVKVDFLLKNERTVIFVNGCFWHGCPRCWTPPKKNRTFWVRKMKANKTRDEKKVKQLKAKGWNVVVIWGHELKNERAVRTTKLKLAKLFRK